MAAPRDPGTGAGPAGSAGPAGTAGTAGTAGAPHAGLPADLPVRPGDAVRPPALPELGPAVEALPGLARVAASAWWHTAEWSVRSGVKASRRVARAAVDPSEAGRLVHDVSETAHAVADLAKAVSSGVPLPRAMVELGAALGERVELRPDHREARDAAPPVAGAVPGSVTARGPAEPLDPATGGSTAVPGFRSGLLARLSAEESAVPAAPPRTPTRAEELRRRGAELLERSRDVWATEVGHPAYERILDELAPDEGRILLLLLKDGPQPSVDVRTGGPVGLVSSQLIAPGLTMIGARAGVRWVDQVPAYLNNLFRLGLVWFSREALRDPLEYQVVEAQPDVLAAMHSVKFAKVVRRSIHLTPFGENFCRTVLVDAEEAAAAEYPEHDAPPETAVAEPPSQA